jgi:hypothetical protein
VDPVEVEPFDLGGVADGLARDLVARKLVGS